MSIVTNRPPIPRLVIGLAGGSGSGKTTVARAILERVGAERITYVPHDAYYRNFDELAQSREGLINWDHPDSLETELMIEHITRLKEGQAVQLPIYDFAANRRTAQSQHLASQPVIVVEGILILADARLRALFDMKIYVDTDADLRFIRRLQRDVAERGRTLESVVQQYLATVRPMHLDFVEPSKRYADVIVPEGGYNTVTLAMIAARITELLNRKE